MALPAAHAAVAMGLTRNRAAHVLLFLVILSILPDFDFGAVFLTWIEEPLDYHRTWSHSLLFAGLLTLFWNFFRPRFLEAVNPGLFFCALLSHSVLDMLCTSDAADHGVAVLWPFVDTRYGWPVLVPLYQQFALSPFSVSGALKFTTLELLMSGPLFLLVGMVRVSFQQIAKLVKDPEPEAIVQNQDLNV